ncbi:MAG: FAD-dependent oxidoreductase [Bacillota bacterium]
MNKTYIESPNTLPVYDECDVLVVGGGAAGHSAALAAARAGAEKVILMERYGYFGGDATGGYVIMLPHLSWRKYPMVRGIQEEWCLRIEKNQPDACLGPSYEDLGKTDPILLDRWESIVGCTNPRSVTYNRVIRSWYFEPNQLKIELDMMIQEEPNIKALLHCWGTKPIMEGNTIKGVIFESKEGRQCIFAKVVIDATGDGDIFQQAGAPCLGDIKQEDRKVAFTAGNLGTRFTKTALVWRMGGIDWEAYCEWRRHHPELHKSFVDGMCKIAGYQTFFLPSERNDVCWANNLLPYSCIEIEGLKNTEFMVRNSIRKIIKYAKEALPLAFRNAYLYDIAPQLGTRGSRRIEGEYVMTKLDFACHITHDDVIAWHSCLPHITDGVPVEIPYRCILPKKVENLLCPGRHLSADDGAIDMLNLIPQCVGTGQAAGVAAAVAAQDNTTTHNVDIKRVQKILCYEQNVPLPRQENTDPELVKELEDCKYGTMTPVAIKVRQEAGLDW